MKPQAILGVLLVVAVAGGCAHAPVPVVTEVQLHEPLPGLYTSGQPAPGDWRVLKARGVRTVVDLRLPGELKGRDEAAEVRAAGLRYVNIPVDGGKGLTETNARALHAVLAPAHGGVLVHCSSGNRAGALLALEQERFDALPPARALQLGEQAGVTGLRGTLRGVLGLDAPEAK